jgi:hypothetical protein
MASKLRQFLAIMASTLAVAACQDTPTEVAADDVRFANERTVEEALYDLTGSYTSFPCDEHGDSLELGEGELISLAGQVFERTMFVRDGAGQFHFTVHTMPVNLTGIGVTSGERFRIIERENMVVNQRGEASTGSIHTTLKLVGETGRTFWLRFTYSYRIGNDGALLRERTDTSIVCRV